jgi:hypothetical protein
MNDQENLFLVIALTCVAFWTLSVIILDARLKTKTKLQNYESALNIYIKCREKSTDKSICLRPKVQDYLVVN